MDVDTNLVNSLFKIKKNQLKMVRRRGYNIEREENLLFMTLKEFMDVYIPFAKDQDNTLRGVLTNVYENKEGEKIVAYFADIPEKNSTMGVESLKEFLHELEEQKSKNGIIITSKQLSSKAKKEMERLVTYNVQVFLESEMGYDPIEHYLTPEHILLTEEEQREFLTKNDISIDQLPIILDTDMISRYYGYIPGQVIKINRINMYDTLVPKSISYRAVKENTFQ